MPPTRFAHECDGVATCGAVGHIRCRRPHECAGIAQCRATGPHRSLATANTSLSSVLGRPTLQLFSGQTKLYRTDVRPALPPLSSNYHQSPFLNYIAQHISPVCKVARPNGLPIRLQKERRGVSYVPSINSLERNLCSPPRPLRLGFSFTHPCLGARHVVLVYIFPRS